MLRTVSEGLGEAFDADGMVCHILLEVRENQQQFQHTVALIRVRLVRAFLQIFYHRKRIGKQPIQAAGIERAPLPAALQRVVRANKRLVKKVIQAELLAGKTSGDRSGASFSPASSNRGSRHSELPTQALPRSTGEPNIIRGSQTAMRGKIQQQIDDSISEPRSGSRGFDRPNPLPSRGSSAQSLANVNTAGTGAHLYEHSAPVDFAFDIARAEFPQHRDFVSAINAARRGVRVQIKRGIRWKLNSHIP